MTNVRLGSQAHKSETLDAKAAAQHLRDAPLRGDQLIAFGRSSRRVGWIVGGIGAALGLLGMGSAALAISQWKPAEPQFIRIDGNGETHRPIRAVDAPQQFTEGTAKQYLRMYVEACESYRWETARVTSRRCSIMLSPQQQTRYADWFAASNPVSPQARFGRVGEVRIQSNSFSYNLLGTGRDNVQLWSVRFVKIEVADKNGAALCLPWMNTVQFKWMPMLEMSPEDREVNHAGFQAITYDSQPDPVRIAEPCR